MPGLDKHLTAVSVEAGLRSDLVTIGFRQPAGPVGPSALRPALADGLPLSFSKAPEV